MVSPVALSIRGEGSGVPSLLGEPGLEGYGEAPENGECWVGESVNKKIRGSICQNDRWLTNIFIQPSPLLSSVVVPTDDSSVAMRPIRSNFCNKCLPLNIPSLLMFTRHSPFGLPSSGISGLMPAVKWGFGADLFTDQSDNIKLGQKRYLMEVPP